MIEFIPSNLRALHLTGPDALDFSQSQVTLDIGSIPEQQFFPAAWCDPKGRALTVLLIARCQQHVMAVLPTSQAEIIGKRLNLFRIGRKVELSSAQFIHAALDIESTGTDLENDWARLSDGSKRAIRMKQEFSDAERPAQNASADSAWTQIDLERGFPWLSPATSGQFIPQMLGLEQLQGLSYRKGCYPGQEVIARVHYRGKVTRKTMRFEIAVATQLQAGDELMLDGQKGVVLYAFDRSSLPDDAAAESDVEPHQLQGLAVVPIVAQEGHTIEFNGAKGHLITL